MGSNPIPSAIKDRTPRKGHTYIRSILKHYHIWTIGCQMNKAESARLEGLFERQGYVPAASPEEADLVVLNSCVVRQSAEDRVNNKLDALRVLKKARPELVLAVTGCLVDSNTDELKERFPFVDSFFKPGEMPPWYGEKSLPVRQQPGVSVYVPIIEGCNNFCSYCIVPYRRGRERSRPPEDIICEVAELARRGTKEVVLLGQNVDSYGNDLPQQPDLADLLAALDRIESLARLRFLTNHPKDMGLKLIEAIARLDKVCKHLNLPCQAGDDAVLAAMRRGYSRDHYRELVGRIRDRIPGVALSTDIIVGFPGEGETQFEKTIDLLTEIKFDTVHVAAYSPRPGTLAARHLKDDVPAAEKKRRLDSIEQLQTRIAADINARLLHQSVEVLVEGRKQGKWYGRTGSDKLVFFTAPGSLTGSRLNIIIEHTSPWSLQGRIESNKADS